MEVADLFFRIVTAEWNGLLKKEKQTVVELVSIHWLLTEWKQGPVL